MEDVSPQEDSASVLMDTRVRIAPISFAPLGLLGQIKQLESMYVYDYIMIITIIFYVCAMLYVCVICICYMYMLYLYVMWLYG